jgi:hypothetical protein
MKEFCHRTADVQAVRTELGGGKRVPLGKVFNCFYPLWGHLRVLHYSVRLLCLWFYPCIVTQTASLNQMLWKLAPNTSSTCLQHTRTKHFSTTAHYFSASTGFFGALFRNVLWENLVREICHKGGRQNMNYYGCFNFICLVTCVCVFVTCIYLHFLCSVYVLIFFVL